MVNAGENGVRIGTGAEVRAQRAHPAAGPEEGPRRLLEKRSSVLEQRCASTRNLT